jgi:hypothetical protein
MSEYEALEGELVNLSARHFKHSRRIDFHKHEISGKLKWVAFSGVLHRHSKVASIESRTSEIGDK